MYYKVNTDLLSNGRIKINLIKAYLTSLDTAIERYKSGAQTKAGYWANKYYIDRHVLTPKATDPRYYYQKWNSETEEYDEVFKQNLYDADCQRAYDAAKEWVDNKVNDYLKISDNYGAHIIKFTNILNKFFNVIDKIEEGMETIETFDIDLEAAKDRYNEGLINDWESGNFAAGDQFRLIDLEFGKETYVDENGVERERYVITTRWKDTEMRVSVPDATAAASQEIIDPVVTAPMDVAAGRLRGKNDQEIDQGLRDDIVNKTKFVDDLVTSGKLDIRDGQEKGKQKLWDLTIGQTEGVGNYSPEAVRQILDDYDEKKYTPEEREARQHIVEIIQSESAAISSQGYINPTTIESLSQRPYDISGYLDELPATMATPLSTNPVLTPFTPSTGAPYTPSYDIPSYPSTPEPATPQDVINTTLGVNAIVGDNVPASIPANSNSIDAQAKEIFYNRDPQDIAAQRDAATSAVEEAFNGEHVEEFKAVLKEGGFDDVDVDFIMENKEVAVTAYILATESKSLTDIANKLAAAQGIQNFDTMYDNGLNRMQLENGLSASKLMAEVDDDVVEARTNVQNARTKYNSSVKKANDSIDEANKKKEEMEELRKKIVKKSGEDTSKWDDDDIEAYNKAIEEYNEANKAANAAHKEALANKELLDDAESTLAKVEEEATQKYMDQNQGTVEGVQQRPEETDVSTATPDVDELQPSVDSPTVETVESHPGELTTDDVSEIVNADTSSGSPSPKQTVFKSLDPTQDEVVHNDSKTLAKEDVLSLFDDLDDVATITDADRTLESFDLSALSAGERVLPGTELSDVISGDTKGTLAMGILPQDGGNAVVSSGNSMVDLAESVASQGNSEMNSFQDLRFNSLGNGYADVSGEAAYTSNETESEEEPEKPKTRESESSKDVAGIQVEQEESARHTDGVLVEEEPVASEVSDDGRSLEFVEID